ncbi:protein-tyrosine kinase 6 isoform X2 [Mixophyes fleayi]|uniref:protein-tyrosine kinase 6 isoform X2 n=1 Tax=Mixophyes fleayi TaxID=3061075 RepID=UPI003F4DB29F
MDGYIVMNQPAQRYVSQWDFEGCSPEELSFKSGDQFQVLDKTGDWWHVEKLNANGSKTGKTGYVPYNYLAEEGTVEEQSWFFGDLSRTEAVNLLMKRGNGTGSFLIRVSDKQDFVYALSVRMQDTVKHFKILRNSQAEYHLNNTNTFPDVNALIDFFHLKPVAKGIALTSPCLKDEPETSDLCLMPLDEWERPREEFTLERKLGKGNFAQVYEASWQGRLKIKVAIKAIKQSNEGQELNVDGLLDIAGQVVDGMHYLEANNCIHRDLAARNVLIGRNNICKVADFGLARFIKDECYISYSKEIPYKWTAPEVLAFGCFTHKSDVWAFGVLLYEIMSRGMNPYPGVSNSELLEFLKKGKRMKAPENCSNKVYNVMLECWDENPKKRPTFNELKVSIDNLANYEPSEISPKPSKTKGWLSKLKK